MRLRGQRLRDSRYGPVPYEGLVLHPGPASDVEVTDFQEVVPLALGTVPDRCCLILAVSRKQDLTYGQISRVLGIWIKTVETKMGRALKRLRTQLACYLSLATSSGTP